MKFFDNLCRAIVQTLGLTALTRWRDDGNNQWPLGDVGDVDAHLPDGPKFTLPNSQIECDYSAMKGYKWVGGSQTGPVGSWLEPPDKEHIPYNIFTDYENVMPTGTFRYYHLDLINGTAIGQEVNADGKPQTGTKFFNASYPGPWIQACWGDTLSINVTNRLKTNGTSIHWHGIRQLTTWNMDGVNAVTQCAIAPNDSMTYTFQARQYGTSWYHSHYSLQYPDGVLGPLTIFGPSSAHYDDALDPWLVTDWSHQSAFTSYDIELTKPPPPMDTILLNGTGTFNCTSWTAKNPGEPCPQPPKIFNGFFQRGKSYLIRLINTSTASTFIFSVDQHVMKVIGMDFVPIKPYTTKSVFVGIGQRYHVVIQAIPDNELVPVENKNYWIRAVPASGCFPSTAYANETVGVIRYDRGNTKTPTTSRYQFDTICRDEPYDKLTPVVWKEVGKPSNQFTTTDDYVASLWNGNSSTIPNSTLTRWSLTDHTLYLNFSDPSINHIRDTKFPPEKALVFQDYGPHDWVYLIVEGKSVLKPDKHFVPIVHPIHLHGHDFFLIAQQTGRNFTPADVQNPDIFHFKNPPRRDVALLPVNGYIALAFQTDNPGIWLMHCHIAWHASSGLALQIFERQPDVIYQSQHQIGWSDETDRVCGNWNSWLGNPENWFNSVQFQEDSGI